ncbi:MAG TPA: acyl-CoA dehydrogenase, partial [Nitrososphaeria archaeon]|nr:acyl-CoA dehydrogenase [Nitrososphaeria archaeon]
MKTLIKGFTWRLYMLKLLEDLRNFELKFREEHLKFLKMAREFAEREVEEFSKEIEERGEIPERLLRRVGELGFFGITIPREFGGLGSDLLSLTLVLEEISKISIAVGFMTLVPYLFTTPLTIFGSQKQKKEYLPMIASGRSYAAHAATEPTAGSDLSGIRTVARPLGGEWIIEGVKRFVSCAKLADYFIVLARVEEINADPRKQLTFFIVNRDAAGLDILNEDELIGIRGVTVGTLRLSKVPVPDENRLGSIGEGLKIALETYGRMRAPAAALALGGMEKLLTLSINYSLRRRAYGKSLADLQAIQFKLADLFMTTITSKLLVYWAAETIS